jgi:energy-coupling factor transport system ATP-binding protein
MAPREARRLVTLVPQTPGDLLYLGSVQAEIDQADRDAGDGRPAAAVLLHRFAPDIDLAAHPRDLSEGQRLALVLAVQLRADPHIVLLDEPTRGLDYPAKHALAAVLDALAGQGHAVLVATHDVEFAAYAADRVIVLAQGEIVADGAATDVLAASPAFAPQVAKILSPLPYLTLGQVTTALARR